MVFSLEKRNRHIRGVTIGIWGNDLLWEVLEIGQRDGEDRSLSTKRLSGSVAPEGRIEGT